MIALILGGVTNVLVTAWCVYAVSTRMRTVYFGRWTSGGREYDISLCGVPGKAMAYWHAPDGRAGESGVTPVRPGMRPPRWTTTGDEAIARRLAEHPPSMGGNNADTSLRCDVAYGWPWLAFRGGITDLAGSGREHDFGPELGLVATEEGPGMVMVEPRTMPRVPIVPGVVVNTGLYGGAWGIVLWGPGAMRRWRRRRRGACTACGYDRRGIGAGALCPECGMGAS